MIDREQTDRDESLPEPLRCRRLSERVELAKPSRERISVADKLRDDRLTKTVRLLRDIYWHTDTPYDVRRIALHVARQTECDIPPDWAWQVVTYQIHAGIV